MAAETHPVICEVRAYAMQFWKSTRTLSICLQFIWHEGSASGVLLVARRDPLSESVGRKAAKDLQPAGLASKVLHFNSLLTADHLHSVCLCCHRSKGSEGSGRSPWAESFGQVWLVCPPRFACDCIFNLANFRFIVGA